MKQVIDMNLHTYLFCSLSPLSRHGMKCIPTVRILYLAFVVFSLNGGGTERFTTDCLPTEPAFRVDCGSILFKAK